MAKNKKHPAQSQQPDARSEKPADAETQADTAVPDTAEPEQSPADTPAAPPEPAQPKSEESGQPPKPAAEKPTADAKPANAEKEYSFRSLVSDVQKTLARYNLPDMLLTRCIALYFLLTGFFVFYEKHSLHIDPVTQWRDFIPVISTGKVLIGSAVFLIATFLTLCSVSAMLPKKARIVDHSLAIGAVLFFDIAMLWRVNNLYLTTAVAFVSIVFIYYILSKLPSRKPYEKIPTIVSAVIVVAATVGVTWFIATATIAKHRIYGTACHDFGLFVQMYHSLSHSIHAITTCERDKALSHFYVHASYIYYLLVPFYKMVPKETTLLVAQAILAMGGAIPTYLIAKRHNIKGLALILVTFMYVFGISVISPCFYDFHENAFLPTLLMWLFYAIDSKKYIMTWIMTVLVCIVKEDAPLYIVCIGLFMFFEQKGEKKRWHGLLMAVLSGIYMMFITSWLTKHGDGSMMTSLRFGNLMINSDAGLREVVKNVLLDPAYFFSLLLQESTLECFLKVMTPLMFLPFCTKKIHRFWLMIPFLIMNMTIGAGYGYAASIDFHYMFGPICLLYYSVIINISDFGDEKKHDCSMLLGSAAVIFFVGIPLYHWDNVDNYNASKEGFQAVEECLDRLPADGVVCATPFFVSHCAEREEIYLFDFNDTNRDTKQAEDPNRLTEPGRYQFLIFGPDSEIGQFITPYMEAAGWTVYDEVPHRVVIYQNPNFQPQTQS